MLSQQSIHCLFFFPVNFKHWQPSSKLFSMRCEIEDFHKWPFTGKPIPGVSCYFRSIALLSGHFAKERRWKSTCITVILLIVSHKRSSVYRVRSFIWVSVEQRKSKYRTHWCVENCIISVGNEYELINMNYFELVLWSHRLTSNQQNLDVPIRWHDVV